jgi:Macoilin family
VWIHTEKGICLPTILLWLLFVWMEANIRWKDNRNMPHLDLCRPFAAHCIGYPVVTLGFGFKSYIGYRIRQRKQKEIAKENEFYMQLLQQALPQEEEEKTQEPSEAPSVTSNGNATQCKTDSSHQKVNSNGSIDSVASSTSMNGTSSHKHHNLKKNPDKENGFIENNHQDLIPNNTVLTKPGSKANNLNFNNLQSVKNTNTTSYQQIQNGIGSSIKELNVSNKCSPYKNKDDHNTYISSNSCKKEYEKEKIIKDASYEDTMEPLSQKRKEKQKDNQQYHQQHQPHITNNTQSNLKACEQCQKLEQEAKRLKSELQAIKSLEQESKQKLDSVKGNLQSKQKEFEEAQKQ